LMSSDSSVFSNPVKLFVPIKISPKDVRCETMMENPTIIRRMSNFMSFSLKRTSAQARSSFVEKGDKAFLNSLHITSEQRIVFKSLIGGPGRERAWRSMPVHNLYE